LAQIIPLLLEKHHTNDPIIVAPYENPSIKEMIDICLKISKKDVKYNFNGKLEGPLRKDGRNDILMQLIGKYNFTPFQEGLRKTYEWYNKGE
jgi:GDP-L-fucose synthase